MDSTYYTLNTCIFKYYEILANLEVYMGLINTLIQLVIVVTIFTFIFIICNRNYP